MIYSKNQFKPRKPVRTFRDLEVYQLALQLGVLVIKKIIPVISNSGYVFEKDMIQSALNVSLIIADAHSTRFNDKELGLKRLDDAMKECDKMIVYLEQIRDLYNDKIDAIVVGDLIKRYVFNRRKIFRLYSAWKKWFDKDEKE